MIDKICDLFEGRIVNHPEMMLEGQIGKKGRCEFSYIVNDCAMILLIELKFRIQSSEEAFSKIVAQVCAEADGFIYHILSQSNCSGFLVQCDSRFRSVSDTSHFNRFLDVAVFLV